MEADLAISGLSGARYDGNGMANAALAPWTLEGDDAGDFSNNAGMLTFSSRPTTRCRPTPTRTTPAW